MLDDDIAEEVYSLDADSYHSDADDFDELGGDSDKSVEGGDKWVRGAARARVFAEYLGAPWRSRLRGRRPSHRSHPGSSFLPAPAASPPRTLVAAARRVCALARSEHDNISTRRRL